MLRRAILVCAALAVTQVPLWSSPFDDLASALPAVRDKAAKQIRDQHLEPSTPRAHWVQVFAGIDVTKPDSADTLINRLPLTSNDTKWTSKDFSRESVNSFPLDSFWLISFTIHQGRLTQYEIESREIAIRPAPGYSGFWKTYRTDGSLAAIYDYEGGRNLGNTLKMK